MFLTALSKRLWRAGTAKASVNSASKKAVGNDPKPSELAMSRVKDNESCLEARTRRPFNVLG